MKPAAFFRQLVNPGILTGEMACLSVLFVLKTGFPWLSTLFFGLLLVFLLQLVFSWIRYIKETSFSIRNIHPYFLLLGAVLVFLLSIHRSELDILDFSAELYHLAALAIFALGCLYLIRTPEKFLVFRDLFFRWLTIFGFLLASAGFLKFWLVLREIPLPAWIPAVPSGLGSSLIPDNDSFILPLVAALIGLLFNRFRRKNQALINLAYHFVFLMLFYVVLWSGSKKGFVLMMLLFVCIIILRIYYLFHANRAYNYRLIKNLNVLILVLGFSALAATWLIVTPDYATKEKWIEKAGFNRYRFKSEVTLITYAHLSSITDKVELQDWYDRIWSGADNSLSENALKEKIAFMLREQEKSTFVSNEDNWVEKAYDTRRQRFEMVKDIFRQYTPDQKFLGIGFGYLDNFPAAVTFEASLHKGTVVWQNNYLISALLYSGILGALLILLLAVQSIVIWRYYGSELLSLVALMFLAAGFRLFSHNVFLTEPLLLMALLLPVHYKYIMLNQSEFRALPENVPPVSGNHDTP
ncbi:MAG TPA: hypothetical protein P5228_10910 [Bacteroidales bacterium]|nr:hypothetical protein [Bacteroidales bacterium]HRZ48444.1 hypothetical protein [Bacteroidales bacterium]